MARRDPQINVRVPEELKDKLHQSAAESGRSVNSEIVTRLELSLLSESSQSELPTAEQAKLLSDKARGDNVTVLLSKAHESIRSAISKGQDSCSVRLHDYGICGEDDPIIIETIDPVIEKLKSYGYTVDNDDIDSLHIQF